MEKHVTLRDIAKLAGVHFTTVGLALRNDPHVNAKTAARVREVARRAGYTPNAMLSALSAYRQGRRFAGTLAYVLAYDPKQYVGNLAEATLANAVADYCQSQSFSLETFQVTEDGISGAQLSRILQARGIQGVLLAPRLPVPGPISNLDWPQFSTIAVGFSITNVAAHRVCIHHAYNMRLCLRTLRSRGYRRIGLIVRPDFSDRSLGVMLGSFLAEQYAHPQEAAVRPLYTPNLTKATVTKWLKSQRVDCVVLPGADLEVYDWIREAGYSVPGELGLALISRFRESSQIAGIDEQNDLLGVTAAKCLVSLLQHNERGLPAYPIYTMVEGRWVDGPTIRPAQAEADPINAA
ncbi:MAG: LacI family DNA-binding transcriptional regulator [Verrucomicrobia bacterium]|nr:LacI family DNA-binding transcriptional regulator [Verrucomicrobiota bacterium]